MAFSRKPGRQAPVESPVLTSTLGACASASPRRRAPAQTRRRDAAAGDQHGDLGDAADAAAAERRVGDREDDEQQQRRPDEERPLAARRPGQLAHGEERHRDQQPALGAAGERERDAEERPVEHDEGVRELGRALARDADGVDADEGAGQGRRRRGAVSQRQRERRQEQEEEGPVACSQERRVAASARRAAHSEAVPSHARREGCALHAVSILTRERESFKVWLRVELRLRCALSRADVRGAGDGRSREPGRSGARHSGSARIVAPMERQLFFSGNEAIAHGAVRAGAGFACGYPGTPSTEIIEATAGLQGIHSEWCVNEKVALETAVGASLAGVRTIVTMKHVGLNVAADPFMTLSLTGVNAGLVVISADDPGMHSSQNEQDNRNYAKFAKIPMLEPSDSQEAYDFVAEAFALSEEFDTPVMLRTTTRVSHGRGQVLPRVPVVAASRATTRGTSASTSWSRSTRGSGTGWCSSASRSCASARRRARSTCWKRARRTSASSPRASPTPMRARRSPRPGSSSWACRTRCPTPRSRACTTTSRAWPSSRSSTRSSRSRCARSACR